MPPAPLAALYEKASEIASFSMAGIRVRSSEKAPKNARFTRSTVPWLTSLSPYRLGSMLTASALSGHDVASAAEAAVSRTARRVGAGPLRPLPGLSAAEESTHQI